MGGMFVCVAHPNGVKTQDERTPNTHTLPPAAAAAAATKKKQNFANIQKMFYTQKFPM